ncbi:NAD(P)/FAD-dependent oxidoreductase [Adhaeribacter soli]|uniref:FAD-binding oxidoreductase n=1 Tax=Adhaeribacter soli TaxID=2607655 RepID=A0A5N1J896_9BACT|nr:FAD-dependent oxidoreductase [Adhaeribacter soli]KAA9345555.1 FAD-binding oxidoreductase [Adhaeribacter soli]
MLSFWETESFLTYNYIIIGSGIVGLSAAISLKEKAPDKTILVLERGLFPSGASTRNAGFASFGSLTELLSDLHHTPPETVLALTEKRWRGLARLRERLPDSVMDYQHTGGFELLSEKELPALESIEKVNEVLKPLFPEGTYTNRPDLVKTFGFDPEKVKTIVYNPYEGHLHTGKLMKALLQLAQSKGVEIRTGAEVMDIKETESGVRVYVQDPVRQTVPFQAEKVAVCTNAFSQRLLPEICITPGRGQVIITKPIPDLKFQGAFHFDEGYYYFRNVGQRVLFGGGRNLAFKQEATTDIHYNETILKELEKLLREVILPGQKFEIDQRWSGIMGFTEDKQPIIRKVSDRITVGFACNGIGVALSSTAGDEIAGLLMAD